MAFMSRQTGLLGLLDPSSVETRYVFLPLLRTQCVGTEFLPPVKLQFHDFENVTRTSKGEILILGELSL